MYVNLEALFFISNFTEKISKFNPKKVTKKYLEDFITFIVEIGIIAFESENYKVSSYLFQIGINIVREIGQVSLKLILPYLGLAISKEVQNDYSNAAIAYKSSLDYLWAIIDQNEDNVPIQLIHEIASFGYIYSFLGMKREFMNDFSNLNHSKSIPEVRKLLNTFHKVIQYGIINLTDIYQDYKDFKEIFESFDFYFETSIVSSSQTKNSSMALKHLGANQYFPKILAQLSTKGADKGILVVESDFLKDLQIFVGKRLLPSLNIIPETDSSYVYIDDQKIQVSQPFVLGQQFEGEIELNVQYKKIKGFIKRKISVKDALPALFHLDISKELKEAQQLKEGGIRHLNAIYTKEMSNVEIIQNIANISLNKFEFKNEQQEQAFFRNFANIFKKINKKEMEKQFKEISSLPSSIAGKALKLVILQRLASSINEDSDEISQIVENVAKN